MEQTLPKKRFPEGITPKPEQLVAGRYGTQDMIEIWGPEKTFEHSLTAQAEAVALLSELYPHLIAPEHAAEIKSKANLESVKPERIRELEEIKGHDVIAITTALEEVLSEGAKPHPGKIRTSADTTATARAVQTKKALEVIADSAENLRDIVIETAIKWIDHPHMDLTHLYDALPTVAGRPFAHYAEMLQSCLEVLKLFYNHSIVGKWGDATGNHHGAVTLGIDGMKLQEAYCKRLGIGHMVAAAQVPGLEFEADIFYALTRIGETINNIAAYVAFGRGDDVNIFTLKSPKKKRGSSAMPHKDAKGGNPTAEEQTKSLRRHLMGKLVTAVANCEMPYARDLSASANARINFTGAFKFLDHGIRNLAETVYWLGLREKRSKERVERSFGVVTSSQVLTYLTDRSRTQTPMPRSEAHELLASLATEAYENERPFIDVLLTEPKITACIDEQTLRQITDPISFIGQSKEIIREVAQRYYRKKTLA